MKRIVVLLGIFLMGALLFACAPKARPPVSVGEKPSEIVAPAAKTGWEADWKSTINAARREGKVVIYSGSTPVVREAIEKGFKERFGITVETVVGATGAIAAKIIAEYRANLPYVDLYLGGPSTITPTLKPAGVLAPIKPVLVLPEVLDPKLWQGGELPFVDKDTMVASLTQGPSTGFIINTSLVKPGEVHSYQDLLSPNWKGKIVMAYPARPPGGLVWFTAFVHSGTLSLDYMRALARQEPMMSTDRRQAAEWLSRGKYAISIGTGWSHFDQFYKAGMPVKQIDPKEGDYISAGAGGIGLMKNAAHPNAAKVLVNWLLSKEGSTVYSHAYDKQSLRIDVSTEGMEDIRLRKPGVKYIRADTEEMYLKQPEYSKIADEIFGHLLR